MKSILLKNTNATICSFQVLRIQLFELEKVQDLCNDFCKRYTECLKNKMHADNLLQGTINNQTGEYELDLSDNELSSNDEDDFSYMTKSKAKSQKSNNKTVKRQKEKIENDEENQIMQNKELNDELSLNTQLNLFNELNKELNKERDHLSTADCNANNLSNLILDGLRDSNLTTNDLQLFYEQMLKLNETSQHFNQQLMNNKLTDPLQMKSNGHQESYEKLKNEKPINRSKCPRTNANKKFKKSQPDQQPSTSNVYDNLINEKLNGSSNHKTNKLLDKHDFDLGANDESNEQKDDLKNYQSSSSKKSQKRGVLPKAATTVMKTWLFQHIVHPYPSEEEKKQLAEETNLTLLQVRSLLILLS